MCVCHVATILQLLVYFCLRSFITLPPVFQLYMCVYAGVRFFSFFCWGGGHYDGHYHIMIHSIIDIIIIDIVILYIERKIVYRRGHSRHRSYYYVFQAAILHHCYLYLSIYKIAYADIYHSRHRSCHRTITYQKRPITYQKRPIIYQKRPIT